MKQTSIKKQKPKKRAYIKILFSPIIGFFCGIFLVKYLKESGSSYNSIGSYLFMLGAALLMLSGAIYLNIILHEAGHLLFGLFFGFQFSSFRIGSLMLIKENGTIRLRKMAITGTAGQCLMNPPELKKGKWPFLFYNLGGSFTNFIVAAVFLGVNFFCGLKRFYALFCVIMGITGIWIAFVNGIPIRMGAVDNDGCNAASVYKFPSALRSFWVQLKVSGQMAEGVRLKDMPSEWFFLPNESEMQNSMTAVMAVFYENRLMDLHKFEEAGDLIQTLRSMQSSIMDLYENLLICDQIYCALIRKKESEALMQFQTKSFQTFRKQMKNFPVVLRTEYAVALLHEQNPEKAGQIREKFKDLVKTYPYAGDIESEWELVKIAEMDGRCLFCHSV